MTTAHTTDARSGVRLIGDPLSYADGAEHALLATMQDAADRSSLSDELATGIVDWPTRYHLSRLRANLLRPLTLSPGLRVLDVGAGTGALSRYLGEQGASVVALEGSLDRARVAAARCAGLPSVEVVCGPLSELDDEDGFDLVVVCGVLEYSSAAMGGAGGPDAFLDRVRGLCRDDGAVVLAIENQLGLKYLLGYAEDHLGRPWVGIEGYPDDPAIRTWSRRRLAELLDRAGFDAQRWLYPYPDYKLPSAVVSHDAYAQPDATDLVDQLVRLPVRDYSHPPLLLADERSAHRSLVDAGLGPDVANSFVVVASSAAAVPDRLVDPDVVVWRFGDEREARWLRATTVRRVPSESDGPLDGASFADGRLVAHQRRLVDDVPSVVRSGWLRQEVVAEAPYVRGTTLEQQVLDACRRRRVDEVASVLRRWRAHLSDLEVAPADDADALPLRPDGTPTVLPDDHLDVALDNFVDDGGPTLHFIDSEWRVDGGVATHLVVARSLWGLARTLVTTGVDHPWSVEVTVDELAVTLGGLAGVVLDDEVLEEWRTAEGELQHLVNGQDPGETTDEYAEIGRSCRADFGVTRELPFSALRRANDEMQRAWAEASPDRLRQRLADAETHIENQDRLMVEMNEAMIELREDIHRVVMHGRRLEGEVEGAHEQLGALADAGRQLSEAAEREARLHAEVAELNGIIAQIRSRLPFRVYLKLKALAGRG
ncbi:MAG: methyltransferase domain-containing protein [Acidimicrobiia bacterium]|nr:methyltransferase domain-containing protein [Acidimicrobiia bacterium]